MSVDILNKFTEFDRVELLIAAMTKVRELNDALLEAEEAGLELEVEIETTPVPSGQPLSQIIVTALPSRRLTN